MNDRYPGEHQAIRRAWAPYVAAGVVDCWRCGRRIPSGAPWDLGHDDDQPGVYRGPEHARCNRSAGAGKGNALRRARRERSRIMLTECVLAIEVSEDRRHTSIGAAGWLDGYTTVEVAAYLPGVAETVPTVLRLRAERTVKAVVVDPHSYASNLIRALTEAGIEVTEPDTAAVAAAHGEFRDRNDAGALRHVGSPELDAAVRAASERRLGGAAAWDRRNPAVDASPLLAVTLALWGLLTVPPWRPPLVAWGESLLTDDGVVAMEKARFEQLRAGAHPVIAAARADARAEAMRRLGRSQ